MSREMGPAMMSLIYLILSRWSGKYNELERRHGFIQWL